MPYTRLAAMALVATAIAATGCGGSSTTSSSSAGNKSQATASTAATQQSSTQVLTAPTKPLTRAELIAKADKICKHLNLEAASLTTTSLQSVGTTSLPLAGYYRAALAELRTLTPPTAMTSAWKAMIADIQQVPGDILTMGRYALDNDTASTFKAESKVQKLQQHRFAIARRNGFIDCREV